MAEGFAVAVVRWEGVLRGDAGADGPEVEGIGAGVLDYGVAVAGGGVGCVGEDEGVCSEDFVGWPVMAAAVVAASVMTASVMTASVMTASVMTAASVMGRAATMVPASVVTATVVWGAVVVGGFFQVRVRLDVCVHGRGLVASLVMMSVGLVGVRDAVFQVHVGDGVGGWVEAVHAVGHGQGEAQEEDEENVHLVGVCPLSVALAVDALPDASSRTNLRSYIFRHNMKFDEMHKGDANVAVQPSCSTGITIQIVIEWCNILVTM